MLGISRFLIWWSILFCATCVYAQIITKEAYLLERNALIADEMGKMLGSDLTLNSEEEQVNGILMKEKISELYAGFNESNFLPAKSFFLAKQEIDQSRVLDLIKRMPKGSILHIHEMGMASIEWVVSELTYWDNLYMCYLPEDRVLFRFFNVPDDLYPWVSVAEYRNTYDDPNDFDQSLINQLSIITDDPTDYPDLNTVWVKFEKAFQSLSGLATYAPAWESFLTRALQELVEDNVCYLEFRAGLLEPLYNLDGRVFTSEEFLDLTVLAIQTFTANNVDRFYGARFIYAPYRRVDEEAVWDYIEEIVRLKELYPNFVAGFDLVGQEELGHPLKTFIDPLLDLQRRNISVPFFFHAGETYWHGLSSDENLFDALLLNTTRIGHGYAIAKHPSLIEIARKKDIPVEINPISNQVLMLIKDLRNHPMSYLIATNFPVVVSSDSPSLWGALPLSHDFYEAFFALGGAKADLRFLKKLSLNSIRYSSLNEVMKSQLEDMWQIQWDSFITNYLAQQNIS